MVKIEEIKAMLRQFDNNGIDSRRHDGSYSLVQCIIEQYKELLCNNREKTLNDNDINLIYFASTIRSNKDQHKKYLNGSSLSANEKDMINNKIDDIWSNIDTYQNVDCLQNGTRCIGMFAASGCGKIKSDDTGIKQAIVTFIRIFDGSNLDENIEIKGMKDATFSQIAHCISPLKYPVVNGQTRTTFKSLGLLCENYDSSIKDYLRSIQSIKNELNPNENKSFREIDLVITTSAGKEDFITDLIDDGNYQIVFTGAPGTGKTYSVEEYVKREIGLEKYRYEFVQFHPSYDYSDFVEGLRPITIGNTNTFVRMDGLFKEFCRIAAKSENKNKKFYFVIDEINRADLSKVFGELMYCLEKSKRGPKHRVQTQYRNLKTYYKNQNGVFDEIADNEDIFKEGFYIPENVIIIGTMNDIDKSVEAFDFALRRRFKWVALNANDEMGKGILGMYPNTIASSTRVYNEVVKRIIGMNKKLVELGSKFGLTDDYMIGHAYFTGLGKESDEQEIDFDELKNNFINIYDSNIASIIKEYLRGRNQKDIEEIIEKTKKSLIGE